MWRKYRSITQDHINYIRNDIVKPFKFRILRYSEHVIEMHDLSNYLPPPLIKGESAEADNWTFRNKEFTVSEIQLEVKYRLPSSMQDELEDHQEDYFSLTYEDWCDLLSTI